MNRRDALLKVALLFGGTLTAPTLLAMSRAEQESGTAKNLIGLSLSDSQRAIIAEVAEHIIPKTTTAGAKDAGVPAFIELMLNDCYRQPEHISFMEGVVDLEKKNFLSLSKDEQVNVLKQVEQDTKELMKLYNVKQVKVGDNVDKESMDAKAKGVPFWRLMKELTLTGYFTSEAGIKGSFIYEPIPGKFEAIKIKPGQKSFAY
jgi:hypothetical protein